MRTTRHSYLSSAPRNLSTRHCMKCPNDWRISGLRKAECNRRTCTQFQRRRRNRPAVPSQTRSVAPELDIRDPWETIVSYSDFCAPVTESSPEPPVVLACNIRSYWTERIASEIREAWTDAVHRLVPGDMGAFVSCSLAGEVDGELPTTSSANRRRNCQSGPFRCNSTNDEPCERLLGQRRRSRPLRAGRPRRNEPD